MPKTSAQYVCEMGEPMFSSKSLRRSSVLLFVHLIVFLILPGFSHGSEVTAKAFPAFNKNRHSSAIEFGIISVGETKLMSQPAKLCAICSDGGNSCEGVVTFSASRTSNASNFSVAQDDCAGVPLSIALGEPVGQCCDVSASFPLVLLGLSQLNYKVIGLMLRGLPGLYK